MPALLVPGMTVTNEPGIYKTGRHGVRTENTMLIVPSQETDFGTYYKFEPLTLCPIDKEAILTDMPVSYTHLDVYKRQIRYLMISIISCFVNTFTSMSVVSPNFLLIL